jgi:hypothetical protein
MGEAGDLMHHVAVRGEPQRVDAVASESALSIEATVPDELFEALLEAAVARIDVDLLSRLGIFEHKGTYVRDLFLSRVRQPHGEDLVVLAQSAEGGLPV